MTVQMIIGLCLGVGLVITCFMLVILGLALDKDKQLEKKSKTKKFSKKAESSQEPKE